MRVFGWRNLLVALGVVLFQGVASAQPALTIEPITWDVIGLDSNNVNTGPNVFVVAARVRNAGSLPATNVAATFVFDGPNPFINLSGPSSITIPSLAAGESADFYFDVAITRTSAAYDTARPYHIEATATGLGTVATPPGRQLYVEHLVSQNRNAIFSFSGPTTVFLGDTVTYTITGKTATQGYEQLEFFTNFPSSIFRVKSVQVTYSAPAGATNDTVYADACGWDQVARMCVGPPSYAGGKAGGNPISTVYTFEVVGTGSATVSTLVYDFSGSSYHYNSDFGTGLNSVLITASSPPDPTVRITATDPTAAEVGLDPGTFTISRAGSTAAPLTVFYSVAGSTTPGADYAALGASVTIPAGQSSAPLALTPLNDALPEGPETVVVTILRNAAYTKGLPDTASVTIADEDAPTVTIAATDAVAVENPTNTGTFTVTRTGSTAAPLAVNYAIGGSATNGTDYAAIPALVTIPTGAASATVTITPSNDNDVEGDEVVVLTLAPGLYNVGTPSAAAVTIQDDEPVVTIAATTTPGQESATPTAAVFTVTRRALDVSQRLDVDYTVSGTATNGTDYATLTGTVRINANQTTATIVVTPTNDALVEGPETVTVTLTQGNPVRYAIGDPADATVTLLDDDAATVTVTATDASASEAGPGTGTVRFTRSGGPAGALTVFYFVSGTATSGADFAPVGTSATIAAGSTFVDLVVTPLDDMTIEPSETVVVSLAAGSGGNVYNLGTPSQATVTIADDDQPQVAIGDVAVTEGNSGATTATFTVTLSRTSPLDVTVQFSTADGTALAPGDYAAIASTTLTIPAGSLAGTIDVLVNGDLADEPAETFLVRLANPTNATIADAQATGTISNDDDPSLSIGDAAVTEGNSGTTTATFTVTLSAASAEDVTVQFSTADGTALAPGDYAAIASTTLTIPAGSLAGTIDVLVNGDTASEANETFLVNLAGVTNATLADAQATGTISNDDAPAITIADTTVTEGDAGTTTAVFTVMLSSASPLPVTVEYSTTNGSALAPADYAPVTSMILTIPAGALSGTVDVLIAGDVLDEAAETFLVNLANATNATIADAQATGTIANDDDPAISVGDVTVVEGNAGATAAVFTLTLSRPSLEDVTVEVATANGTALVPADYAALASTSVTIPAGLLAATVTVDVAGDRSREPAETFFLDLADAVNATVADARAVATIQDDDVPAVRVTPTTLATVENGPAASITVQLDTVPTADVTITIASSDPTEGTVSPATLVFTPANALAPRTVTVMPEDDLFIDGPATFTIASTAASADPDYDGRAVPSVSVTNADDDAAGVVLSSVALVTTERGAVATFTMRLRTIPIAPVTITLASSDTTEGRVSPGTITFTPEDALVPRTFTISPGDDLAVDGTVGYSIVTSNASSADPDYANLAVPDIDVANADDDAPGVTISRPSLATVENGPGATFTIRLDTTPTADVTIPLASGDPSEGAPSVPSVTFTPADALVPRLVTVLPADDALADGPVAYAIVTGPAISGDPSYAGLAVADVAVTNQDDDSPGFTVTPLALTTREGGDRATFTVRLNTVPLADVTVAVSSLDPTEGVVSPAILTFTPANALIPKTVVVTPQDDDLEDGPVTHTIALLAAASADPAYDGRDPADVAVTNLDGDRAGFIVSRLAIATVESGSVATFEVSLATRPTSDVTVSLASTNPGEGTVSAGSITFTPADALVPRTVTIAPGDDAVVDGPVTYLVVLGPAASLDLAYDGRDPPDVSVTNGDDESAGIAVSPAALRTRERGAAATFQVRLTRAPTSDVTLTVSSSNPAEGLPSPATLTFTPANQPIDVAVLPGDDGAIDGPITYTIVLSRASSADPGYANLAAPEVVVTNEDDDAPRVIVMPTSLATLEGGAPQAFTVQLSAAPQSDVTVVLESTNAAEATLSTATLVFTPANALVPQSVTVAPGDDAIVDGPATLIVSSPDAASADPAFDRLEVAEVLVANADDDSPGVVVTPLSLATSEGGGPATFSVRLTTPPAAA